MRFQYLCAILVALSACSQRDSAGRESALSRMLPGAPAGWREVDKPLRFSGASLSDYINGGAEAYLAYGFQEVAARKYGDDKGDVLTVEIYLMDKPENAYGVFSSDSGGDSWPIGTDASYSDGLLRFWKGPYFVRVVSFPLAPEVETVIRAVGVSIADSITAESRRPALLGVLPETGVHPDSVCYFHRQTSLNNIRFVSDDNLLHLDDRVEALTWEQDLSGKEAGNKLRHLVIQYPSSSDAENAFRDFMEHQLMPGKNVPAGPGAGTSAALLPNGKFWTARIKEVWALVILDAPTLESALSAAEKTAGNLSKFMTNVGRGHGRE